MKKKILYVIHSSEVTAGGGHYYTLITLTNNLKDYIDFRILNIGVAHSRTLRNNTESDYIKVNKASFFSDVKNIKRYVQRYSPDVLHVFDHKSVDVINSIRSSLKIPVVFSKCGGKNGYKHITYADIYICFSIENKKFMEANKRNNNPIYLLPNRANTIIPDKNRIQKLKDELGLDQKRVIMRISRISTFHFNSIVQSINLLKFLVDKGNQYELILIGTIQSMTVYAKLKQLVKGYPITFVTDEYFTNNAATLLDLADVIIGTGRGVMEAASLGKKILCPIKGAELPAPLNEINYGTMSKYNFSERTIGVLNSESSIIDYLNEPDYISREFISQRYTNDFDIKIVIPKYLELYNKVKFSDSTFFDKLNFLKSMAYYLKPKFLSKSYWK